MQRLKLTPKTIGSNEVVIANDCWNKLDRWSQPKPKQEISVHGSYDRYVGWPEGTNVEHVPYNGNPFSDYYIATKNGISVIVQFGVGGVYVECLNDTLNVLFGA